VASTADRVTKHLYLSIYLSLSLIRACEARSNGCPPSRRSSKALALPEKLAGRVILRVSGEQVSASLRGYHKTHGLVLHAPALFELHGRGQLLPACFAKQNSPLIKRLDELSLLLRSFPV
jgi:hypothetical protein